MSEATARKNAEWEERMHQGGTLLEYCEALRASSTGMSDPMSDELVADVRLWMSIRLGRWQEPTCDWDGLVRAIVEHSLRCYHLPPGLELSPMGEERMTPEERVALFGFMPRDDSIREAVLTQIRAHGEQERRLALEEAAACTEGMAYSSWMFWGDAVKEIRRRIRALIAGPKEEKDG